MIEAEFQGLSAQTVNQYIRGELFIFQDFLCHTNIPEEHQPAIVEFLYEILNFCNAWLKKAKTLIPLQAHWRADNDLYMIDANIALLYAHPEIKEMLMNLFGSQARNHKYFLMHDREAVNTFKKPVAKYSKDKVIQIEEDEYDLDDCREAINQKKVEFG